MLECAGRDVFGRFDTGYQKRRLTRGSGMACDQMARAKKYRPSRPQIQDHPTGIS